MFLIYRRFSDQLEEIYWSNLQCGSGTLVTGWTRLPQRFELREVKVPNSRMVALNYLGSSEQPLTLFDRTSLIRFLWLCRWPPPLEYQIISHVLRPTSDFSWFVVANYLTSSPRGARMRNDDSACTRSNRSLLFEHSTEVWMTAWQRKNFSSD